MPITPNYSKFLLNQRNKGFTWETYTIKGLLITPGVTILIIERLASAYN